MKTIPDLGTLARTVPGFPAQLEGRVTDALYDPEIDAVCVTITDDKGFCHHLFWTDCEVVPRQCALCKCPEATEPCTLVDLHDFHDLCGRTWTFCPTCLCELGHFLITTTGTENLAEIVEKVAAVTFGEAQPTAPERKAVYVLQYATLLSDIWTDLQAQTRYRAVAQVVLDAYRKSAPSGLKWRMVRRTIVDEVLSD